MSEANRALPIRWMDENWNKRREAVIDELMHPECVGRMEGGDEVKGREGWRKARLQLLDAFPDLRMEVQESVAEGDTVVLLWRVTGTHEGDGLGFPRSNRKLEAVGSTWMKFKDGQMVWGYDTWNMGGMVAGLMA